MKVEFILESIVRYYRAYQMNMEAVTNKKSLSRLRVEIAWMLWWAWPKNDLIVSHVPQSLSSIISRYQYSSETMIFSKVAIKCHLQTDDIHLYVFDGWNKKLVCFALVFFLILPIAPSLWYSFIKYKNYEMN